MCVRERAREREREREEREREREREERERERETGWEERHTAAYSQNQSSFILGGVA